MGFRKVFTWISEGIVLLTIVFIVNAQLFISLYYQAVKLLDKIKSMIL
jgi:uncharacterized membrane protein